MFTPPPSPLLLPRSPVAEEKSTVLCHSSLSGEAEMETLEGEAESIAHVKQRTARRTRWSILLVPAVLILVALSTRHVSLLSKLEEAIDPVDGHLDGDVEFGFANGKGHGESFHRRAPSPQAVTIADPAAKSDSVVANAASTIPTTTSTVPQTQQTIPPVPDSSNPPVIPTPFPQPFDSQGATAGLITVGCQAFFTNMTQSTAFRSCRPLSLLEQTSAEFIDAQTNLTELNTLVYGTCNTTPSFLTCTLNMGWFASALPDACSKELDGNVVKVQQTLLALQAYPVVRTAGCLVDQKTNTYCYSVAVHEQNPSDLYLYQLPLGVGLPNTTIPSCSACASSLFGVYAAALQGGNNSAQGLKTTYESAADQAASKCGSGYAQTGLVSGALGRFILGSKGFRADGWILAVMSGTLGMLLVS